MILIDGLFLGKASEWELHIKETYLCSNFLIKELTCFVLRPSRTPQSNFSTKVLFISKLINLSIFKMMQHLDLIFSLFYEICSLLNYALTVIYLHISVENLFMSSWNFFVRILCDWNCNLCLFFFLYESLFLPIIQLVDCMKSKAVHLFGGQLMQ